MTKKPSHTDKSFARLFAVQTLFQVEATRRHYQEVLSQALAQDPAVFLDIENDEPIALDAKLAKQIVSDAVYHQIKIDQTVNKVLAKDWPLKSVDPTLRAVFRAAGAEFIRGKAPVKVVINEYLDITRAFDDRKETVAFVNAVLDNTRKQWETDSE